MNPLEMFPAKELLVSVGMYTLGQLTKARTGRRLLSVITDMFTNMNQKIPLRKTVDYTVARAFGDDWVYN